MTKTLARTRSTAGFSLVEMMTVIVIVSILAGTGLTAMHHFARAAALNVAARRFADQIAMARQYAVANSSYVFLVVATDQTTNSLEYPYSSYAFCTPALTDGTHAVLNYSNVVYIGDIQFLRRGVVFDCNGTSNVPIQSISFPNDGTNVAPAWVVTFTPNGQILPLSRRPYFTLYEGVINPATLRPMRTEATTNYCQVEINPLIGKPIASKYP